MQRLSLLAAGAAAMGTSVTLIDDGDVKMELEYYVYGGYLRFVASQSISIDAEIKMAS